MLLTERSAGKPYAVIELCAGLVGFSRHCVSRGKGLDLISRIGSKGSAPGSLSDWTARAIGLDVRRPLAALVWCEPDPAVYRLLTCLPQPDAMRGIALKIRSWIPCPLCMPSAVADVLAGGPIPPLKGEAGCEECGGSGRRDARRLWTALKDAAVPESGIDSCAAMLNLQSRSIGGKPISGDVEWDTHGFDRPTGFESGGVGGEDLSRRLEAVASLPSPPSLISPTGAESLEPATVGAWLTVAAWSWKGEGDDFRECQGEQTATRNAANQNEAVRLESLSDRLSSLASSPMPPVSVVNGVAQDVTPAAVAGWMVRARWSYEQGNISTGFVGPGGRFEDTRLEASSERRDVLRNTPFPPTLAANAEASSLVPGMMPDGVEVVAILDIPYYTYNDDGTFNLTTGYGHTFDPVQVVEVAKRWSDAGALVVVHNACPIRELDAIGWHSVEILQLRQSQALTFRKASTSEWITVNRPIHPEVLERIRMIEKSPRRKSPSRESGQTSLFGMQPVPG